MILVEKGQQFWVPSRREIAAACLEIQADWDERERHDRAGLRYRPDVYLGDPVRTGVEHGLASPTIDRE